MSSIGEAYLSRRLRVRREPNHETEVETLRGVILDALEENKVTTKAFEEMLASINLMPNGNLSTLINGILL